MSIEVIFEYATRKKLRFSYKGSISTEDLWDLSLEELDRIFMGLNAKVKQSQEESLLEKKEKSEEEERLEVQIAVVRRIVEVKLEEQEAKKKEADRKAQKQKLMAMIAEKQDEALKKSSIEELEKMLAELGE